MTFAFGGQHSIQLSYGCLPAVVSDAPEQFKPRAQGSLRRVLVVPRIQPAYRVAANGHASSERQRQERDHHEHQGDSTGTLQFGHRPISQQPCL